MRIVLTLDAQGVLQTPETPEVLAAQVRFHLEQGVDVVLLLVDPGSAGLLEGVAPPERLQLLPSPAEQAGADWLLEARAGEFWWARRGSLRELLESVAPRFDAVRGPLRRFVARPDRGEPYFERTTVRRRAIAGAEDAPTIQFRQASRGARVHGPGHGGLLRDWYPLELLQLPLGSDDLVDDEALSAGLAAGALQVDTRLRDALHGEPRAPVAPGDEIELAEELELALADPGEGSLFPLVESLDGRLAALERSLALASSADLRRLLRR